MVGLAVSSCDDLHVILRFIVWRNPVVLIYRTLARVVTCECQFNIPRESLEQPAQILRTSGDVLLRIVRMLTTKSLRRRRYQLHQPLRASVRTRMGIVL